MKVGKFGKYIVSLKTKRYSTLKLLSSHVCPLDLHSTCEEIRQAGDHNDPFGSEHYTIDCDQEGPLEPFTVQCNFELEDDFAITTVYITLFREMTLIMLMCTF